VRSNDPFGWGLEADESRQAESTTAARQKYFVRVDCLGMILLQRAVSQPLFMSVVSAFMRATVARRYGSGQPGEMAWVLSQSSSEGVVDLIVWRCRQAAAVSEPIGIPDSLESEETHGDWSGYSTRSRFAWRSPVSIDS